MRALPVVPLARLGVVTAAELSAAGWSVGAVRHALDTGGLERVAPGRFAAPPPSSLGRFGQRDLALARRAVAAVLPLRRTAVGLLAAATVRGWPVWADDPQPCIAVVDARVRAVTGVHLHRTSRRDAFFGSTASR